MADPEAVDIGVISDVHYGNDEGTKCGSLALPALQEALDRLAGTGAELLVDLGDRIIDESPAADLERQRRVLSVFRSWTGRIVHLSGNHDVDFLDHETLEAIVPGPVRHHSIDVGGWHLCFWFADVDYRERNLTIDDASLQWLEADLAATEAPAVVFSHVPLGGGSTVGNYYFERKPVGRARYVNGERVRELLARSSVTATVAGHVHWNTLHTVDGIHHLTLASLTETFVTHPHVSGACALLTLRADGIRWQVYGRDPREFVLPLREPHRVWLRHPRAKGS